MDRWGRLGRSRLLCAQARTRFAGLVLRVSYALHYPAIAGAITSRANERASDDHHHCVGARLPERPARCACNLVAALDRLTVVRPGAAFRAGTPRRITILYPCRPTSAA